jgi:hypothetical protein
MPDGQFRGVHFAESEKSFVLKNQVKSALSTYQNAAVCSDAAS